MLKQNSKSHLARRKIQNDKARKQVQQQRLQEFADSLIKVVQERDGKSNTR